MEEKAENGHRRTNKPLMEKRRRARINMCLGELKNLVLMAMNKDNSQFSKLEKADILEMAVKYLRHVQNSSMATSAAESTVMAKYQMGYGECAREVMLCLGQNQHVGEDLRNRISDHLTKCLYSVHTAQSQALAMRNFQSLGLIPPQMRDGRIAQPSNGLSIPGFQGVHISPESNYMSTMIAPVVKVEPTSHSEPQNLSAGFNNDLMAKVIKTEPLSCSSEERHFVPNSSPVSMALKMSPAHSVVSSNHASFTVGNSARSVSPSSHQSIDKRPTRKRRLSQDGNVSSSTPHSSDNMASSKQRRLSADSSATPNKPVDESVWRPW